jgi:phosphoheptose isomerase/UTP-glucose-1-phosphate uridylyltransferase
VAQGVTALDQSVLQRIVDALVVAWREQRQVFVMGNGGSATTASHMALDLNKMTSIPGQPRLKVISLCDNVGWIMALGNDISFDVVFAEQLRNLAHPGDLVIAISCSGNSKNVLEALRVAHELNCQTIGLTGDTGGKLKAQEMVDICLIAPVPAIGQQEDLHVVVNHILVSAIHAIISSVAAQSNKTVYAAVLAAGEGTRLRPLTLDKPKPMVPIGDKPLLDHTVRWLGSYGLCEIAINLNYKPDVITNYFGDGTAHSVRIAYSREDKILGTAGGVLKMSRVLNNDSAPLVVVYGDVLTDLNLQALLRAHRANRARDPRTAVTMALYRVPNPTEVGLVGVDASGKITKFVEKPKAEEVFTDLASAGVLILEPEALAHVPAETFYDFGLHLFPKLMQADISMYGWVIPPDTYLLDIGSPEKYAQANREWPGRVNTK